MAVSTQVLLYNKQAIVWFVRSMGDNPLTKAYELSYADAETIQ